MTESDYLWRHIQDARTRAELRQAERSMDARSDRHYHAAMDRRMGKWLDEHPNATTAETMLAITWEAMEMLCPPPLFNVAKVAPPQPYVGVIDVGACWPPVTRINVKSDDPWS